MSRIRTLEKNCGRSYAATRAVRERVVTKAAIAKSRTEEIFHSPTALIGAFSAGVIVDQLRQQRHTADGSESGQKTREDSQQAKTGVLLTPLLIRLAAPYIAEGFMASSPPRK